MTNETTKKVLKYTLTPQIIPRVQKLFFSGFSYIAFFMAQIYNAARLLPAGHPYLTPSNMGRYGIRHVIAEAGSNLSWKKENSDQIIVFFIMLLGLIMLGTQFAMLILTIFVQGAHAALGPVPDTFASYFLVPDATHDLAFVLLDRVFGIPDLFVDAGRQATCVVEGVACFDLQSGGARVSSSTEALLPDGSFNANATPNGSDLYLSFDSPATIAWPWPFHDALHKMFEAYSIGILLIGVFIFLYFIMAIIAETAQSGTPFGRRFNHVWAPLRLIAAMGLLIPLTHGINSGQWILLHAAKWGSGFATNGWTLFYEQATTASGGGGSSSSAPTLLGARNTLVAVPNAPPVNTLIEFSTILATCRIAYERMYHERFDRNPPVDINAYLVNPIKSSASMTPPLLSATNFEQAVEIFDGGDIEVVFGELRDDESYQTRFGGVAPLCGAITIPIASYPEFPSEANPGSDLVAEIYYDIVNNIWENIKNSAIEPLNNQPCTYMDDAAIQTMLDDAEAAGGKWLEIDRVNFTLNTHPEVENVIQTAIGNNGISASPGCIGKNISNRYLPIFNNPNSDLPSATLLNLQRQGYQYLVNSLVDAGAYQQTLSTEWLDNFSALGWGGAAVWYNKVAQLNGSFVSAAYSMPTIKKYPLVMEIIRAQKAGADKDMLGQTRHQVYQGPDRPITLSDEEEVQIAKALFYAQLVWSDHYAEKKQAGNIYIDIINAVFGTSGLFDMQKNADIGVHPLAQLSSVGRSIIDTAIRNLGYSAAAGLGGGIVNLFGVHMVGNIGMAASGFLLQVSMAGLSIGFILFYIVPLLPFIYFFFAVGGWVKGIFEAMVGVPLWALAHIRIDGNGLPGDAAMGGYYLILEIFLRPILIIFGFLASVTIFSAQVQVLHEIWPIVVSNAAGFDVDSAQNIYDTNQTGGMRFLRGTIDKFFFTSIYAIVVYMLAMASFKMIDLVPNHILRWMGASVSSFGDQSGDPAENLVRNSYIGTSMLGGHMTSGLRSAGQAAQQMPGAIGQLASRSS